MKLNTKLLLCTVGTMTFLLGTVGCGEATDVASSEVTGTSAEEPVVEEENVELAESPKEEASDDVAQAEPASIKVNGLEITYPITRDEFISFGSSNGLEEQANQRFFIKYDFEKDHSGIHAEFMTQDENYCSTLTAFDANIELYDNINTASMTPDEIFNTIISADSGYEYITATETNGVHSNLVFARKDSGITFRIRYSDDYITFYTFPDEETYNSYGEYVTNLTDQDGDYLSSTDVEGLYMISAGEESFSRNYPKYFTCESLHVEMDNARICAWANPTSKYQPNPNNHWTGVGNIWYGEDASGNIVQIYDDGDYTAPPAIGVPADEEDIPLEAEDESSIPEVRSLDEYTAYYLSSTYVPGLYEVVDKMDNVIATFRTDETELCTIDRAEITTQTNAERPLTFPDTRWTWEKSHGLAKAYASDNSIVIVYSY